MISFNVPPYTGAELDYIRQALVDNRKICGDGPFTKRCSEWIETGFETRRCLLTTSGTTCLEMAARLAGLGPGDEAIMPSFTFSSTANAVVQTGATPVFIDVRPDTMNMDEEKIEAAITSKTKALVPVHYAGVACEMDRIMDIAARHGLYVIEDAAQGVMSRYKGKALGAIGHFGCYSFHETKNYSMGEGGALLINDVPGFPSQEAVEKAEIMREKGTDRSQFMRGQVDKYTWVDYGSSYLPSDVLAAHLWAQLECADEINHDRLSTWDAYYAGLKDLEEAGRVELPVIPESCEHNAHMFWLKCADLDERTALISYLREHGIVAVFHYVPLHSAPAGLAFGRFAGVDEYTTRESDRLLRLPMYYQLSAEDRQQVLDSIHTFFREH